MTTCEAELQGIKPNEIKKYPITNDNNTIFYFLNNTTGNKVFEILKDTSVLPLNKIS